MFAPRFTAIVRHLQTTMGNHVTRHDLHGPLLVLVWNRLTRMFQRFERLVAQWRAGTLPKPRPSRAGQPRPTDRTPSPFPRQHAWLLILARAAAAIAAFQLRTLMTDAELRVFLAECPRAGRVLRPLCHMLGMHPSETELAPIRLPARLRKPRKPRPKAEPRRRLTPIHLTRAQIDRMTAAELTHLFGRLPPHFPLPIPNLNHIRRKIAAG